MKVNRREFLPEEKKMFEEFIKVVVSPNITDFNQLAEEMNILLHDSKPVNSGKNLRNRWYNKKYLIKRKARKTKLQSIKTTEVKTSMENTVKLAEELHRYDIKQATIGLFNAVSTLLEDHKQMRTEMIALRELISAVEKYSSKRGN